MEVITLATDENAKASRLGAAITGVTPSRGGVAGGLSFHPSY